MDRADYARTTGRDYLPQTLDGIRAARAAGFGPNEIKLNAVLMRGKQRGTTHPADPSLPGENDLMLRFIELMPVSTTDVLTEEPIFSPLRPRAVKSKRTSARCCPCRSFARTVRPSIIRCPGTAQKIGFIGAMTNLHFCENCNKLRLTCDGKLRPCLGSHLEFDLREPLRAGCVR